MSTCAACAGTGAIYEADPTDSAWFPKPRRRYKCLDCGGTGRRAVVDDDEFVLPGDERPDPPDEE